MFVNGKINWTVSVCSLAVVAFVISAVSGVAQATPISPIWDTPALSDLTGSRDSEANGGVTVSSADWASGDFSISWVITQDSLTKLWTYTYTVPVGPSHTIIEVTDGDKPFTYESGYTELEVKPYSPDDTGNSNPNLPNEMYGAKTEKEDLITITIVTQHAPVWGVFYSKAGNSSEGGKLSAWSNALNYDSYQTSNYKPDGTPLTTNDFIVRPNGVPEPATMSLLALGGLAILARRRRRRA